MPDAAGVPLTSPDRASRCGGHRCDGRAGAPDARTASVRPFHALLRPFETALQPRGSAATCGSAVPAVAALRPGYDHGDDHARGVRRSIASAIVSAIVSSSALEMPRKGRAGMVTESRNCRPLARRNTRWLAFTGSMVAPN